MPSSDPQVFLDANVILEIILGRKNQNKARAIIKKHAGNLHISALSAHLAVHFGKNVVELPILRAFLSDYFVEALTNRDFEWAFLNIRGNDFEDALQLGSAIRIGAVEFITFDTNLYKSYKDLPSIKIFCLTK